MTLHVISGIQNGERNAATAHGVEELGRFGIGVGQPGISYGAGGAAALSSRPIAGGRR